MKFFGFSANDVPSSVKMIYFTVFVGIVGFAIWYGMSKLDNNNKKPKGSNKRRKSPKKTN